MVVAAAVAAASTTLTTASAAVATAPTFCSKVGGVVSGVGGLLGGDPGLSREQQREKFIETDRPIGGSTRGDGGNEPVVVGLMHKTLEDVRDDIILLEGLSCSSKLVCKSLHLREVSRSGEIALAGVADRQTELDLTCSGLRGETLDQSLPDTRGRGVIGHLHQNFTRHGRKQKREHLLILGDPDRMLRIGRLDDLLLAVGLLLGDDDSSRLLDRAIKVACHRRGPDVRKDLNLPYQEVVTGKLLRDGVAEGGKRGHGHGVRRGGR